MMEYIIKRTNNAVINGMGYGGKALNSIGDMTIAGSMIKQY